MVSAPASVTSGLWSYASPHLHDGAYTAQVSQNGQSRETAFTVDTTPPALTISSPVNGATVTVARPTLAGLAGAAGGDHASVTLRIYAGSATGAEPDLRLRSPAQRLELEHRLERSAVARRRLHGRRGTERRSRQPRQRDDDVRGCAAARIGGVFAERARVLLPVVPAKPHVGEPISLVSTSSDLGSPLTAFAWAVASPSVFAPGERVLTTSFATPGAHLVHLRVTDAAGLTSEVGETIPVGPLQLSLM